jgi:hypothetical protein
MRQILFLIMFLRSWTTGSSQTKYRDYYIDMPKALSYSYGIGLTTDLIKEKF